MEAHLNHSVSTWKEISFQKEILAFGRKFGRNSMWKEIGRKYCYKEGDEKEILFYLIISKNKTIFIQFCAKEDSESAISNDYYYYYYLNIFIHGSLSVACFSKGRGLKLLKRYKTKSKPKV
jgi:hypothetical protein